MEKGKYKQIVLLDCLIHINKIYLMYIYFDITPTAYKCFLDDKKS